MKTIIDGFTYPFNPEIFYTVRGCENVHIYFWICKDLGWIFGNKNVGMTFGTLALIWIIVLIFSHYSEKNYEDIYFILPTFLWLFGNYLWMTGNLLYNSDVYRFPASCIMMTGIVLIIFYFAFLKKKKYFISDQVDSNQTISDQTILEQTSSNKYISNGLICRFKSIGTWKRYEFVHMFFWLLKDYCWCSQDKIMWLAGALPTLFVSYDLINTTFKNKGLFVDLIHYLSQLIWVTSNIVWAFSELFTIDSDIEPNFKSNKHHTGRFIASIILLLSWFPIICLYCIWLPLTVMKKINESNNLDTKSNNIAINPLHKIKHQQPINYDEIIPI
jgi:hypothetical protein